VHKTATGTHRGGGALGSRPWRCTHGPQGGTGVAAAGKPSRWSGCGRLGVARYAIETHGWFAEAGCPLRAREWRRSGAGAGVGGRMTDELTHLILARG